jgi:hypothetical protein
MRLSQERLLRRASHVNVKHFGFSHARIKSVISFWNFSRGQKMSRQRQKSSLVGVRFFPEEKRKLQTQVASYLGLREKAVQ